jgi:hypothetical protein
MSEQPERSRGGSRIYRHQPRDDQEFELAAGSEETIDAITAHIEKHIGPAPNVFHELVSDKVHLDVHLIPPTERFPFSTLVTSGMSDRPMTLPPNCPAPQFAELLLCLPATWSLNYEDFADENVYWPIRWLKTVARLPHDYQTWLGVGHTIPNGDPPEPFAENTRFDCWLITNPTAFGSDFCTLTMPDGREVAFYQIVPLYPSETRFKLNVGADALMDRFARLGIGPTIDVNRVNVCPPEPKNRSKNRK